MIANQQTTDNSGPVGTPPPIVPVKPEERRRWQHLLSEALHRGLTIDRCGGTVDQPRYVVSSHSTPGATYEVTVERWGSGAVGTRCSCKAGEFVNPCTHGALAVDAAGLWPRGMVIARQATLPNPDERHEFHLTDRVRVAGTMRVGVVSGIRAADGRPYYRVDDPEAHEPLGMYFSYELVPAAKPEHTLKVDPAEAMAILTGRRAS